MCENIFLVYMLILKSYVILKILNKKLHYSVTKKDIELGFPTFERQKIKYFKGRTTI